LNQFRREKPWIRSPEFDPKVVISVILGYRCVQWAVACFGVTFGPLFGPFSGSWLWYPNPLKINPFYVQISHA
jgi:hypothetical protein